MDVLSVMDRAYERRHELLAQQDVSWVSMMLAPQGVTLTIKHKDGSQSTEFLDRSESNDC